MAANQELEAREKESGRFRVFARYAALQLPGLALVTAGLIAARQLLDLPAWVLPAGVLVWAVKDLAMFPALKPAYQGGPSGMAGHMVGLSGVAVDELSPSGYVRVQGELWHATAEEDPPISRGTIILVKAQEGMTLVVCAGAGERQV